MIYKFELTIPGADGVEEVITGGALSLTEARETIANRGPRNWGRYTITQNDAIVERGDRNPLGVLYREARCTLCNGVLASSGEHLCP